MVESSKKAAPWRQDVKLDSREQYKGQPLTVAVSIEVIFYLPRPQGHYKTINKRLSNVIKDNAPVYSTSCGDGDIDKLIRCTLDGLSAKCGGCVIADDSLVVRLSSEKRYVTHAEACGAAITVVQS
jgi:Holliday junction resolvase RusA-like endonuclease